MNPDHLSPIGFAAWKLRTEIWIVLAQSPFNGLGESVFKGVAMWRKFLNAVKRGRG